MTANLDTAFGRVETDGTVLVKMPDGSEKQVGQWAAGDPNDGLNFYIRKFQELENEILLTLQRLKENKGHTEGSTVFSSQNNLFSGDVLFNRGIGRTDLPGGNPKAMLESLKNVILKFPDEMSVFPGHGPSTTIGDERFKNPYLQDLT